MGLGPKTKTVGGSQQSRQFGNDFINYLSGIMMGGGVPQMAGGPNVFNPNAGYPTPSRSFAGSSFSPALTSANGLPSFNGITRGYSNPSNSGNYPLGEGAKPYTGGMMNSQAGVGGNGFTTGINRVLSGQGLNDAQNQAYDEVFNRAFGAVQNVGLDPNSAFAQGINQMLMQRQEQAQKDLRARYGAQGGMAFGTPASTAEARYLAESTPQIAATLGQYDLQKRGVDLQTLVNLMQSQSQRGLAGNQLGASLIGQMLGLGGQITGMGIPQAQTVQTPGLLGTLGGIASAAGAIASPFTGGLSGLIGGGANSLLSNMGAPIMVPQIAPNPGASPIALNGPVRWP